MPAFARWATLNDFSYKTNKYESVIKVSKIGAATTELEIEYEILKDKGIQDLSILKFPYDPLLSAIEILEIKLRNGSTLTNIENKNIVTISQSKDDQINENKEIQITIPNLKIGSIINLKYRHTQKKPLIVGHFSLSKNLNDLGYVEEFSTQISSELPLNHHIHDPTNLLSVEIKQLDGINQYTFKTSGVFNRRLVDEPGKLSLTNKSYFSITTDDDWKKINQNFLNRVQKNFAAPLPSILTNLINEAKQQASPLDKIELLTNYIISHYNYRGDWQNQEQAFKMQSLDSIVQTKSGDSSDLTLLLARLLRELQFEPRIALVQRNFQIDDREKLLHPGVLDGFNHMVINLQIEDKNIWLDATKKTTYGHNIRNDIAKKKALLIEDPPRIVPTPITPAHENSIEIHKIVSFKQSSDAEVNSEIKITGAMTQPFTGVDYEESKTNLHRQLLNIIDESETTELTSINNFDFKSKMYRPISTKIKFNAQNIFEMDDKVAYLKLAPIKNHIKLLLADNTTWRGYLSFDEIFQIKRTIEYRNLFTKDGIDSCQINTKWVEYSFVADLNATGTVINENLKIKEKSITPLEYKSHEFKSMQNDFRKCFRNQSIEVALGQNKHIDLSEDIEKGLLQLEGRKKTEERYNFILRTSRKNDKLINNKVYLKLIQNNIVEDPTFDRSFVWLSNNILQKGFEDENRYSEATLSEALKVINEGLKHTPNSAGLKLMLVHIDLIRYDSTKATQLLSQIKGIEESPHIFDIINLSRIKRSLNQPKEADDILNQTLLRKKPKWAMADINTEFATIKKRMKDYQGCVQYYQEVIKIDFERIYAYSDMPLCLIKLGQLDKAIEVIRQGLKVSEISRLKKMAINLLSYRSKIKISKKDISGAEADIQESLKIDPSDDLYLQLVKVLISKKDYQSVTEALKKGEAYTANLSLYFLKSSSIMLHDPVLSMQFATKALETALDVDSKKRALIYLMKLVAKDSDLNKKYKKMYQELNQ